MVREARFSWNDADDDGFALHRPDVDRHDDFDLDADEFDPHSPLQAPGTRRNRAIDKKKLGPASHDDA